MGDALRFRFGIILAVLGLVDASAAVAIATGIEQFWDTEALTGWLFWSRVAGAIILLVIGTWVLFDTWRGRHRNPR